MKRYLTLMLCAVMCVAAHARKYNYRFADTPLAEALARVSREHPELRLSFIYNELGNYRTSAHVDTDNGVDAVRRLTAMLPVKVSHFRNGIYVEAMQRGVYRYTGRALGDGDEGVPHATVMLLAPRDSAVLTYSFTGADGRFSVPCDVRNAIIKLSSVGYVTTCRKAAGFNVGDIRMELLPVALKGVTVKTDIARIERDRTVFMPGKREKNASHGGYDLLMAMGIPLIRVSPVSNSITTQAGDGVSTFIDYLPADADRVSNLRPQDVRRVEVYENPIDPRFEGARHVVNFIMVQYEYGGYTKFDAWQRLPDPQGSATASSKFAYKKMTYDVAAGFSYANDNHSWSETQSDYRFSDGEVSWNSETTGRHARQSSEYATVRAVYAADNTRISNTMGYRGSGNRLRNTILNTYRPEIYPDDQSESLDRERSNSGNWKGSYQFFLPKSYTLTVSPTLKYSHYNSTMIYDADVADLSSIAREDAWYGHLTVSGSKRWGNQTLSASLFGEFQDNRIDYAGTTVSRINSSSHALGVGLAANLTFGNFTASPSVRFYYDHRELDDVTDDMPLPAYYIDLGWRINSRHKLRISSEMSNWTVGIAQLSPNVVIRNLLDAVTGNPSLRPYMFNAVGASHQWNVRNNLYLSGYVRYNRWTKPIGSVYHPVEINGREMMLCSLERDGYYGELKYGVGGSMYLLDNKLSLWANVSGNYLRRGGRNCYSDNYFSGNCGVNYYLGDFYFSAYYQSRTRSMSIDERKRWSPSYYRITAGWGHNGFNVSLSGDNLFRKDRRGYYSESVFDNYSTRTQNYSRNNCSVVVLQLSYSFSYGKKVNRDDGVGSTGGVSSGILK